MGPGGDDGGGKREQKVKAERTRKRDVQSGGHALMLGGSVGRNRVLRTQLSELVSEKSGLREHERGWQRSLM